MQLRVWVSVVALGVVVGLVWFAGLLGGPDADEGRAEPEDFAAAVPETAPTTDWPCLHGPHHNGISLETDVVAEWDETGPPELWRVDVGTGYGAAVIGGDTLILLHRLGDEEVVTAFDPVTGDERWDFRYPTTYECDYDPYSSGPYSTPTIDGDRLYTLGAQGQLHCLSLADGSEHWSRSLMEDFDAPERWFAVAVSPYVFGDNVVVNIGGRSGDSGIVAIDKTTGETAWTSTEYEASYGTLVAGTIHGRDYLAVLVPAGLTILDPADGRELFFTKHGFIKRPDLVNSTSPIIVGDRILATTGPGKGLLSVRVDSSGEIEKQYANPRLIDSQFNNLIAVDGHVYGFTSKWNGGVSYRCVEIETGLLKWEWKSEVGRGQALAVGGRFVLFGENGHLFALEVNSVEARVVAKTAEPLLRKPCYTAPALANGRLYLRNERELLCLDLRSPKSEAGSRKKDDLRPPREVDQPSVSGD